ncbi:GNAT family N-acetyltransferase [Halapricum salinum]|uniref:N-acetyltransferase n=1 Tax=Halapricum salinum TaxID=1457250 RepID=A0A4D6HIE5_9EURY|nr:GNAT family protein [Halapricum salinum]QCC52996.1 N-acetyltransferase [Halapricum salinum]
MPGPAFCRGERVSLHTWEEEDAEFFQKNRNEQAIRRPLTDVSPRNREQVDEQFEERFYDDDGMVFLVCTGDDAAMRTGDTEELTRVGEVAIPWVNQPHGVGMLMYWATPEHQGQGYIPEATGLLLDHAFGERRLHKVWAMVVEPNEPSQNVLETLGFEQEGRYRKETFYEGEYVDSYRYAILAEEWLEQHD